MTTNVTPRSVGHREKVLEICSRRGIDVMRTPGAWRFFGPGVDFTVTELRFVYREDLAPYRRRQ